MIGVVDYGVGNLGSVGNALRSLGISYQISSDPKVLTKATALIVPGDGAATLGMENLQKFGLTQCIFDEIRRGKAFLGICLGMQLLLSYSEEGDTKCLDIINGQVQKLKTKLKIPHIGWNQVKIKNEKSTLLQKVPDNSYFYFINSYICKPEDSAIISGMTEYEEVFCSILEKKNIFGVQFHPEKSGEVGFQVLRNFLEVAL